MPVKVGRCSAEQLADGDEDREGNDIDDVEGTAAAPSVARRASITKSMGRWGVF